jgi:hypothetical protein
MNNLNENSLIVDMQILCITKLNGAKNDRIKDETCSFHTRSFMRRIRKAKHVWRGVLIALMRLRHRAWTFGFILDTREGERFSSWATLHGKDRPVIYITRTIKKRRVSSYDCKKCALNNACILYFRLKDSIAKRKSKHNWLFISIFGLCFF